jgi:hypothetical protein
MTIVSARSGYDLEYYLRRAQGEATAGGYYLNAAQKGEDPGRWFGRGARALGLRDGQQVTRDPYLAAYNMIDPRTGERMPGRRPGGYRQFREIFEAKLAAEPHATRERWLELEREAAKETRRSPAYTDATASHNKSLSVLRASFLENARRARIAGDQAAEALWQGRADRAAEIEQEANHAALVHLQKWAGFVRTYAGGSSKVGDVQTGRWRSAGLIVTTWRQGTNRDGEPHDHSHNVIARHAITDDDGVCRAVDTMAVRVQLPAMSAIIESRVRSGFSREFGVRWRARDDGRGHEIDGIPQRVLDQFSTRTQKVTHKARALARVWGQKYGRAPNAREMLFIQDEANLASRQGKGDEQTDWDKLAAEWDRTAGGELAAVADVCDFSGPKISEAPSAEAQDRAIRLALAQVQAAHSTFTRADLQRQVGWAMGPEFDVLSQDDRQAMLEAMTTTALSAPYGTVPVEAPEWPPVPPQLIRDLDGRSVFTRPGTERYATRGQLSLEERFCDQAQRQGAPQLTREFAARQLGADPDELDQALHTPAQQATQLTHTGLRMDQAAMIYHGMTTPRRVSVGVGPAGSGKTHTVAAGARAWEANGGRVIGVTCSQAARNVLAAAGVSEAYNSATLRMEIRHGMEIGPGTLFVIDEGSMMSTSDLAWLVDLAEQTGSKVFLTGDHAQLAAVENGGGMALAAHHLGFTQLSTPVRFREEWEGPASLKLRDGDQAALDQYDQRGRIEGGSKEEMFSRARRAYVAGRLAGENQILMAHTRENCRELGRQIRDDLQHLGLVDAGESKQLAWGAECSAGDLIVCRDNDHDVITDGDHELANGDVFRVETIRQDGAVVRRLLDSGELASPFLYVDRKLRASDLAYARTGHNGQGGTFDRGLAVITGSETLEWLYVAMTRGRQRNTAMAVTHDGVREGAAVPHKAADPAPGTRPDPELARAERVERERLGYQEEEAERPEHEREPIAILADCMERRDAEVSASEYQRQALANADHLSILGARWDDLAGRAERARHEQLVLSLTDERFHDQIREAMAWITRSLRSAELAGVGAEEVLQVALARELDGLEHAGKGLQARLRRITDPLVPEPVRPYAERVPDMGDAELQEYVEHLAVAQDKRADRQGEHAAETSPSWAVKQLGPVPDDPVDRLEWTRRAAVIEHYRGRYGIEGDDLGPEPTSSTPEMRARWWDAMRAAHKSDQVDFRELPDASLVHMVESYKTETAWAPPHVGRQLREVRMGAETMRLQAVRAEAEAQNEADQAVAERHADLATQARALGALYRAQERVLADAQADRDLWARLDMGSLQIAVQADSELRRRYPKIKMQPLKSAEPEVDMTSPAWMEDLRQQREAFRAELQRRQGLELPDEDPDYQSQGEAWPVWEAQKQAILQPPKEPIKPAEKVLERVRDSDRDG